MVATLKDGSYAGWGWGASMTNTEMVIFSAEASKSGVKTYYGEGDYDPVEDFAYEACYDTSFVQNDDGTITITTTRPLECTGMTDIKGGSYVIQLDTEIDLIMAWNPDDPDISFHDGNLKNFSQMLTTSGGCSAASEVNRNPQYITHGVFMWTVWVLIALLQIYTNRYWRHYWKWTRTVHAVLGFFAAALVITSGFIALKTGGWIINSTSSLHSKLGFAMFILGLLLMLGGIIASIIRQKVNMPWKTNKALFVGKVHKWFGRFIILFSQFVVMTGVYNFYDFHDKKTMGYALAGVSSGIFFLFLIIGEIIYQCQLYKMVPFAEPAGSMGPQELQQALVNGRKLVILDDLVIDVGKFIDEHPGGRFVLMHNIGRDISKFFHGGYSLEDNLGGQPARGYTHSSLARIVVNDLAIAKYEPKIQVETVECSVREDLCQDVNDTTKIIVFESADSRNRINWKPY